jgi:transcriptional regulator with XRE-family HTH domain
MTEIGKAVRQRRVHLRLSQAAAAQKAGVSRRTWSEIELGHRRCTERTLAGVEMALELPPGALAELRPAPAPVDDVVPLQRRLVELIPTLSRTELQEVLKDILRRRLAGLESEIQELDEEVAARDR